METVRRSCSIWWCGFWSNNMIVVIISSKEWRASPSTVIVVFVIAAPRCGSEGSTVLHSRSVIGGETGILCIPVIAPVSKRLLRCSCTHEMVHHNGELDLFGGNKKAMMISKHVSCSRSWVSRRSSPFYSFWHHRHPYVWICSCRSTNLQRRQFYRFWIPLSKATSLSHPKPLYPPKLGNGERERDK